MNTCEPPEHAQSQFRSFRGQPFAHPDGRGLAKLVRPAILLSPYAGTVQALNLRSPNEFTPRNPAGTMVQQA